MTEILAMLRELWDARAAGGRTAAKPTAKPAKAGKGK